MAALKAKANRKMQDMGTINPLFPKGTESKIIEAWQQAAFMDDTDEMFNKPKAQLPSIEDALLDLFMSIEDNKRAREERKKRKQQKREEKRRRKEELQELRRAKKYNKTQKNAGMGQFPVENTISNPIQLTKNMISDYNRLANDIASNYRQLTKDMISNYRRSIKGAISDSAKSFREKMLSDSAQHVGKNVTPNLVQPPKKNEDAAIAPGVIKRARNIEPQLRHGKENWKQLCNRIKNTKYHNETSLEDHFVNYLDFIFGWRSHDMGRQVSMQLGHHQMRLDLVLNIENVPSIVIELKNPRVPLNNESILQLASYMKHLDTEFGILTNAFILQLYYRPRERRKEPEEVLTIRFDDKDEDGQRLGELLDRESYSEEAMRRFCNMQQLARQDYKAIIRVAARGNNGNPHKILKQRRHLIENNFKQQSRELRQLEETGEITKKEYDRLKKRLEKETSKAKTTLC